MIEDIANGHQPQTEQHEPLLWQKLKLQILNKTKHGIVIATQMPCHKLFISSSHDNF